MCIRDRWYQRRVRGSRFSLSWWCICIVICFVFTFIFTSYGQATLARAEIKLPVACKKDFALLRQIVNERIFEYENVDVLYEEGEPRMVLYGANGNKMVELDISTYSPLQLEDSLLHLGFRRNRALNGPPQEIIT
eukprot:TRINITY_DN761_c0_g5_i1.p1 TRINITY_DN761_c0_g5~~TRINITY_DN761_c0_g5_i1.p1  ORF type:complete len:135 (+),score=34.56 TRINITY_DN761_c0_g5_i1:23-427(+)